MKKCFLYFILILFSANSFGQGRTYLPDIDKEHEVFIRNKVKSQTVYKTDFRDTVLKKFYYTEYNRNGDEIKTIEYERDGEIRNHMECDTTKNGLIKKCTTWYGENKYCEEYYDKSGKPIKAIYYLNGKIMDIHRNIYKGQKIIKEEILNADEKVVSIVKHKYQKGLLVSETVIYPYVDSTKHLKFYSAVSMISSYDKRKKLIEYSVIRSDTLSSKSTYSYNTEGDVTEVNRIDNLNHTTSKEIYDYVNGNVVKWTEYDSKDLISGINEMKYDDKGLMIEHVYEHPGSIISTDIWKYVYYFYK